MAQHSKRFRELAKLVDGIQPQLLGAAVKKLRQFGNTKFDQSVEISMRLGVDPKQADQIVRGSVSLPNGIGKTVRVAVFAQGDRAEQAKANGADVVGAEDLAEKIKGGWFEFDVCLASPDMMKVVGPLGRVLGPKGLMPTPKTGTMTENIADAVREFKAGKVEYRADAGGNVHAIVGKLSQPEEVLVANIDAFMTHIRNVKPAAVKGQYIRSITISATMSPGVPIVAV